MIGVVGSLRVPDSTVTSSAERAMAAEKAADTIKSAIRREERRNRDTVSPEKAPAIYHEKQERIACCSGFATLPEE
jgi:hypothetical protein